jgi:hypothetical protein
MPSDLIYREDAKDYARHAMANGLNVLEYLDEVPTADFRPVVRGKWIEHNYDPEYLSCDFSCSECNVYLEEYYFGEGQWPGKTDHYFCTNCGADMREES